jgi:hypothetical protein
MALLAASRGIDPVPPGRVAVGDQLLSLIMRRAGNRDAMYSAFRANRAFWI